MNDKKWTMKKKFDVSLSSLHMPALNPSSGPNSIYVIACTLFICLLAGGACLLLLPVSEASSSLEVAGVTLIGLPWAFWALTFLYRILSRTFGFRLGAGEANCSGGGGGNFTNAPENANTESGEGNVQGGS